MWYIRDQPKWEKKKLILVWIQIKYTINCSEYSFLFCSRFNFSFIRTTLRYGQSLGPFTVDATRERKVKEKKKEQEFLFLVEFVCSFPLLQIRSFRFHSCEPFQNAMKSSSWSISSCFVWRYRSSFNTFRSTKI